MTLSTYENSLGHVCFELISLSSLELMELAWDFSLFFSRLFIKSQNLNMFTQTPFSGEIIDIQTVGKVYVLMLLRLNQVRVQF